MTLLAQQQFNQRTELNRCSQAYQMQNKNKKSVLKPKGAWRQEKLIGNKLLVVKRLSDSVRCEKLLTEAQHNPGTHAKGNVRY
jgi:hypothetical protein